MATGKCALWQSGHSGWKRARPQLFPCKIGPNYHCLKSKRVASAQAETGVPFLVETHRHQVSGKLSCEAPRLLPGLVMLLEADEEGCVASSRLREPRARRRGPGVRSSALHLACFSSRDCHTFPENEGVGRLAPHAGRSLGTALWGAVSAGAGGCLPSRLMRWLPGPGSPQPHLCHQEASSRVRTSWPARPPARLGSSCSCSAEA